MREQSDEELVAAFLKTRGEETFRQLYRRHTPRLYHVARRLLGGSRRQAEDVVQEVWLRAVCSFGRFSWNSSLNSWLVGFVVNVAREARRGAGQEGAALATADAQTGIEPALALDPVSRLALESAIEELPDGFRMVLILHDVGGLTHQEIGAILGIDEGTSKSQLSRARARVRDRLE
jgi:RNA polymerase sigma-70 factor (ECF subfamily)